MPIPYIISETTPAEKGVRLELVPAAANSTRPSLYVAARLVAHFLDLSFVLGVSVYAAKFFALALVAIYGTELQAFGHGAEGLFFDVFDYANDQLLGACAGFFGILYFVALPSWLGRTFGLGLFGLRIVDKEGKSPSVQALARRMLGCALIYVSGGSLLLSSLRGRESRLPQDNFSETFVRKAS